MTDLRKLAEQATPGPWEPGHLADDSHPCNCKGIFDGSYAGGLFHAVVDNELPISEGGNDGPPLEEAKANLRYIAAAHPQAVLALLDALERLCDAADAVGIAHFDTDSWSDEVAEMSEATLAARAALSPTGDSHG